jgi:hypothetical protein
MGRGHGVLLLLALFGWAASASGQQLVTFEFSFSNPGARSLGLGGAFAALADDATAAYANPAGLVQLTRPEVSIEGRTWSYATPFTAGGRAQGLPTGIGLDDTVGLRQGESTVDLESLSFLSLAYPFRRWSVGFYRHQLAQFESTQLVQGLFAEGPTFDDSARAPDQRGFSSTEIINYGVSAGFRALDTLSLGIGLSLLDVEHVRRGAGYLPDDDSLASFFAESSLLPERRLWEDTYRGDEWTFSASAGFLWHWSERWRVGGFLRSGFEIAIDTERRLGPATAPGLFGWNLTFTQKFPQVFGFGIAYRSKGGLLTASVEWDHVAYATMSEGDPDEAAPDADEFRLGGEYVLVRSSPLVALRLGAWLDPDHRYRATQGDPFFRALLRPGEDEIHLAAGIGLVLESFQIDVGADLSDQVDTISVSAVYSF